MIKKLDKIVIVGGGSAGWMTAAVMKKAFPKKEIVVIESPKFPTVGVGESTLVAIRNFCKFLEIDEKEFMAFTNASYKLAIRFTDFYDKDSGSFFYSFGDPLVEGTNQGIRDWLWMKAMYPDIPLTDYVKSYFPQAALLDDNKFGLNKYGSFDNYEPDNDVAYHFDAVRFGLWLRNEYCVPRGVINLVTTVEKITTNENGIDTLYLDGDFPPVQADLFIDCTGFKALLLEQTLNVPFKSYEDMLPNDRAWACQVPYINKEKEMQPFTGCTAIENGWCWNTPLWSRIGTGYVYSEKFVSKEDALEEFKKYLMSDKMAVPRTREEVDNYSFRDVPMRVGVHERLWEKNVVAIGLSAGFIEPLESNGLYSVHEFLFKLLKSLQRGSVTQWDRDVFNTACIGMFRNFAEFVALHYALSIRDDTAYWRANADRVYDPGMVNLEPTTSVGFKDLQTKKMVTADPGQHREGIPWISVGMNYPVFDKVDQMLHEFYDNVDHKKFWAPFFTLLETRKNKWRRAAEKELSLFQFLKNNIYKDEE
jgi:tryptophan halogenase